jgi:hypothetical protein
MKKLDHKPIGAPSSSFPFHQELSWWGNDDLSRIGVVIKDQVDGDYSWVGLIIMRGEYEAMDLGHSLSTENAAFDRVKQFIERN